MKRWLAAITICSALTGCASGGIVVLTHPRTGQTVECQNLPISTHGLGHQDKCVKAYQDSGYKITGDTR
jgi:hypothetical protein